MFGRTPSHLVACLSALGMTACQISLEEVPIYVADGGARPEAEAGPGRAEAGPDGAEATEHTDAALDHADAARSENDTPPVQDGSTPSQTGPGDAEVERAEDAATDAGLPDASLMDASPCTSGSCAAVSCSVENSPCDDGYDCTSADVCVKGVCRGTPNAASCNDGNPCTDDICQPFYGCIHEPNTAACNDGFSCTTADVCANGACQGVPSAACGPVQLDAKTCWGLNAQGPRQGQSFTASATGSVSSVSLRLQLEGPEPWDPPLGALELSIFDGAGFDGALLSKQLVETPYSVGSLTPLLTYPIAAPPAVIAGHVYTIGLAITNRFDAGGFCGLDADVYAGGSVYFNDAPWESAEASFAVEIATP